VEINAKIHQVLAKQKQQAAHNTRLSFSYAKNDVKTSPKWSNDDRI